MKHISWYKMTGHLQVLRLQIQFFQTNLHLRREIQVPELKIKFSLRTNLEVSTKFKVSAPVLNHKMTSGINLVKRNGPKRVETRTLNRRAMRVKPVKKNRIVEKMTIRHSSLVMVSTQVLLSSVNDYQFTTKSSDFIL